MNLQGTAPAFSYHSTSAPFVFRASTGLPYLMFSYQTASSTDPGPFVVLG